MLQNALTWSTIRDGGSRRSGVCGEWPCTTRAAEAEDVAADDAKAELGPLSLLMQIIQWLFCPGIMLRQLW